MHENLKNWTPRLAPSVEKIIGDHVVLTGFRSQDIAPLWDCFGGTHFNELAKYFPNPEYANASEFGAWLEEFQQRASTIVFRDPATLSVIGMASYMRIDMANGCAEVGAVCHGNAMQKTIAATEAHYRMAKHIFDDLGYRRYEWKLNNLNEPSHRAAQRLGFTYEGLFRNHIISKGENRDTAWYAIVNSGWPAIKARFEAWLDPSNFDNDGRQIRSLEAMESQSHVRPFEG